MKKTLIALMIGLGIMGAAVAQVEQGPRVSNFYTYDAWGSQTYVEITDFHMACKVGENPSMTGNYVGEYTLHYTPSGNYFSLICKTDVPNLSILAKLGCVPPGYVFKDLPDGCYQK